MNSRIRALFFAALAIVLGPSALHEPAGHTERAERHAFEQVPVEHGAHPAAYVARAWQTDRLPERHTFAPFASTGAAAPLQPIRAAADALPAGLAGSADATRRLPLSRAPPHVA